MKTYTTDNGSRCSGYGVYPGGKKCKGCSDCEGKFLKRNITNAEIHKQFNKTHTLIKITNLNGTNMITQKNYFAKAKEIGIENLPDTFKKSHELVTKVTQSGGNWDMYNSNQAIKKMIDLYFDKLSNYKKPSAQDAPTPSSPSKKATQKIFVVKPKPQHTPIVEVQEPVDRFKKGERVSYQGKNGVIEVSFTISKGKVIPGQANRVMVKETDHKVKFDDGSTNILHDYELNNEIKIAAKKEKAAKTTKPKNEAKESKATLVERLDDEVTLIKRFINFHDKQRTRDQVYNLLKAVQKAILEKRVNKNSVYGKEVMQIQDSLLGALKHDVKIFDIKIEKLQLERYTNIATGVVQMDSIRLIKRYVGLQNKTGILDKVVRLRDLFVKWNDVNVLKQPKYYRYYAVAANNLNDYIQQVEVLKNKNAILKPFADAELNGLGFLPTIIAATAGGAIQAITLHHLNKKKNNLSGADPGVMSVSDAKNETFKEIGLTGDYLQLIGRACAPTSIFIYGNGGSGKSGLSLKLADKLHQLNHSVLYAAGEQYGTPTFTELLKKVNISGGENFKIVKSLNTLPIANFDVIVIDSKESANINKSSDFKQLRDAYPDKIWIITSQGLKSGEYKGDGQWLNEVETFIYCAGGKASTIGEKNRWGGKAEIKLF